MFWCISWWLKVEVNFVSQALALNRHIIFDQWWGVRVFFGVCSSSCRGTANAQIVGKFEYRRGPGNFLTSRRFSFKKLRNCENCENFIVHLHCKRQKFKMSEVFVVFPPSTNNSIIYGRNSFSFCCKEILYVSPNDCTTKVKLRNLIDHIARKCYSSARFHSVSQRRGCTSSWNLRIHSQRNLRSEREKSFRVYAVCWPEAC